jgi:hypothetical protein
MGRTFTTHTRTVAALGAVVVLGGGATALAATSSGHASRVRAHTTEQSSMPSALTSGERTALEAVRKAIAADTASIATPILDKAVSAGTITAAQEQDLLTLLASQPTGGGPGGPGGPGGHGGMGTGAPPTGATG